MAKTKALAPEISPLRTKSHTGWLQPPFSRCAVLAAKYGHPRMPSRPAIHRPQGSGAADRARATRDRERQALRPSPAERGYDDEWRVARKLHLLANPMCTVPSCTRSATDVDHVVSIAERPELRLDPSNFRSMCHEHHAQRTARDQGFARTGSLNAVNAPQRGASHPTWLGPSVVPITVVCGPPASGKSAFVQERAGARDLILDLDVIASMITMRPIYQAPASARDAALRWRNQHLKLCSIRRAWPSAWLIVSEPKAPWREWWATTLKPTRVVVIEAPADACLARIWADDRRPEMVKCVHADAVTQWWADYSRRDADVVLRPGHRPTTGLALSRT